MPQANPAAPVPERRRTPRYACGLDASCLTVASGDSRRQRVEVIDLCADGLGLFMDRCLEPGRVLAVTLRPSADRSHTLLAYVIRARAGPGGWTIGCAFTSPLRPREVQDLTSPVAMAPACS